MRPVYTDLYALFRRDPGAEEYFNQLPAYVQDQLSARCRAVDSLERLHAYADQFQAKGSPELVEEIGGKAFLPPPLRPRAVYGGVISPPKQAKCLLLSQQAFQKAYFRLASSFQTAWAITSCPSGERSTSSTMARNCSLACRPPNRASSMVAPWEGASAFIFFGAGAGR